MADDVNTIRHALYELPPNGRRNHPLRDPALEALTRLNEQLEAAKQALERIAEQESSSQRWVRELAQNTLARIEGSSPATDRYKNLSTGQIVTVTEVKDES